MALVCTPKKRMDTFPCLSCLSDSELNIAFVVLLAISAGYTLPSGTNQMLQDAACYNCLSDKRLFQALVSAYAEKYAPTLTLTELKNRMKCLACANPKQIKALTAFLTCKALS